MELIDIEGKVSSSFMCYSGRLSHRFEDRFFLFTETGASVHDLLARNAFKLHHGTCALTESGEPCGAFLGARLGKIWIIEAHVTFPDLGFCTNMPQGDPRPSER
jgi:hypothetical protein